MENKFEFEANSEKRLDQILVENIDISRVEAERIIKNGAVKVNSKKIVKKSQKVLPGDKIEVSESPQNEKISPLYESKLPILFEDEHILVIDKPAGLVSAPATNYPGPILAETLVRLGKIEPQTESLGVVSRLDKDTTGVMLLTKNQAAYEKFQPMYKERTMQKTYLALATGKFEDAEFIVNQGISRDPRNRNRFTIDIDGREAITNFKVLETFETVSLVRAEPKTGRTHQIRVHLFCNKHPLLGDNLYGKNLLLQEKYQIFRQALHSSQLAFIHPFTGEETIIKSELPKDFERALKILRD